MSRHLSIEVRDCAEFARDVATLLFVPGPSGYFLGERVQLEALLPDGQRISLSMKTRAARHAASRRLSTGVYLSPERADDPAIAAAREAARVAHAAQMAAQAQRWPVQVRYVDSAVAISELGGLLEDGAVLPIGEHRERGDHLDVEVFVGGVRVGVVGAVVRRVHVQEDVVGVVAVGEECAPVESMLSALRAMRAPTAKAISPTTPVPVALPTTSTTRSVPSLLLAPPVATTTTTTAGPALSILIVDDDPDFGRMMRRLLERRGHHVVLTQSAAEIVERAVVVAPDIVVLDRGLPGITGDEAVRRLGADPRTRTVPVLLTSAGSYGLNEGRRDVHPCCRALLKSGRGSEMVAAIEQHATSTALALTQAPATPKTLLLAEDDIDVREQAAAWLEQEGFAIHTANDGSEAIRALVSGLRPAAIVLDLMMPVLSGWAVYEWLRGSPHKDVPVIVWTAAGRTVGTETLRDAPIVEKGAHPRLLLDTIRAATLWGRVQP